MEKKLAIEDNTVSANNQIKEDGTFKFCRAANEKKKIAFLGNSITLHGVKESIGWFGEWGMAASCPENDYCHIIIDEVRKKYPDTSFMIAQGAKWETEFWTQPEDYQNALKVMKMFSPDITVFRLAENVSRENTEKYDFEEALRILCKYITKDCGSDIIFTDAFWRCPWTESAIHNIAKEYGKETVVLSDLGDKDEMKAIGLFAHSGVAAHPGDLGMKAIADRILPEIFKLM